MVSKKSSGNLLLRIHVLGLALLLTLSGSHTSANAESLPATIGSMIPLEKVTDIKAQPLALLAKFPEAGIHMARYVAQVLTREPSAVDSILSVLRDASPQQASAIGAGLVRGTRALEAKHPNSSRMIASKVKQSANQWMKTTYRALGPNYDLAAATFNAAPIIHNVVNGKVGSGLAGIDQGRVGPAPRYDCGGVTSDSRYRTRYDSRDQAREYTDQDGYQVRLNSEDCFPERSQSKDFRLGQYTGMIVAQLSSDAVANNAVSTSPTQ